MKHIKNSIKNSIYLLEHAGVPVALSTDFSEPIINGSLCVDTTNQDLYILRNNVWVKMGSGFNQDDWIPRQGTFVNKPVYGDIEILDGIKLYSGQSGITFADTQLFLEYSDNDGITSINNSLLLNRNIIFQKNDALLTVDTTSKDNFINKITTTIVPGIQFSNSSDNTIDSNLKYPTSFNNVNNIKLSGNINNELNFTNFTNSTIHINSTPIANFANGIGNNINLTIDQTQAYTYMSNNFTNLRGRITGNNSKFNNNSVTTIEGIVKDSDIISNTFLSYYGNINYTKLNTNQYIYNVGHITGNNTGAFLGSASTTSLIANSNNIFNIGILGAINISNDTNTTFIGTNTNIKSYNTNSNLFTNNNGYFTNIGSSKNILINNNTYDFNINSYSSIINSYENIYINNGRINANNSNYNFIANTHDIEINGDNNFIYTQKGFIGEILGDNNVIFSLKPNVNSTIHSNVFTIGNINSTAGTHIYDGNILVGNVEINSTLTTNNQIYGAKNLQNINHSGQINNIFLNVDDFIVPDSNTVYLPYKFYSIHLGNYGLFNIGNITGNQYWNFPDKSGTVALLDDIISGGSSGLYASNGLTINGNTVELGGNLTHNTLINGVNYDITFNVNDFIVNASTSTIILKTSNVENIKINSNGIGLNTNPSNTSFGYIKSNFLTNDRNYQLPNKSGTIALVEDIPLGNVNITNVQDGDTLIYDSASTSWINQQLNFLNDTSGLIINTTYANLYSLATSNNLLTGRMYKIQYQTIHLIPYTSTIHTGVVEDLILTASNSSSFYVQVISPKYNNDIIYYDFYDNKAEDGITNRNGKITYRKDTIKQLEAHYDWRNVVFRRWSPNLSQHTWVGLNGTGGNVLHKNGEVIIHNNVAYICSDSYTSTNTNITNWLIYYQPIMRLVADSFNHLYCLWKPIVQITEDNTLNGGGDGKIYASTSSYIDISTFYEATLSSNFENKMTNISIGKNYSKPYNNIVIVSSGGTFASNYIALPICRDIIIKDNCSDMMLDVRLFYDIEIGYECKDIYVSRDSNDFVIKSSCKNMTIYNGVTNAHIGYDCKYIHINNVYGLNIGNLTSNIYQTDSFDENINIGSGNYQILINGGGNMDIFIADGFADSIIRDNTDSLFNTLSVNFTFKAIDAFYSNTTSNIISSSNLNGSEFIKILGGGNQTISIGKNCNDIIIGGYNGKGGNCTIMIGNECDTIHLLAGGTINIEIGFSCDNIIFNNLTFSAVQNTTIKENCSNVTLNGALNISIERDSQNIQISNSNEIIVGKNCSNIYLNTSTGNDRNTFGNYCKDITFTSGGNFSNVWNDNTNNITISGSGGVSECLFDGSNNLTFNGLMYKCYFGKLFSYVTFNGVGSPAYIGSYSNFTAPNTSSNPVIFFNTFIYAEVQFRSNSGTFYKSLMSGGTVTHSAI